MRWRRRRRRSRPLRRCDASEPLAGSGTPSMSARANFPLRAKTSPRARSRGHVPGRPRYERNTNERRRCAQKNIGGVLRRDVAAPWDTPPSKAPRARLSARMPSNKHPVIVAVTLVVAVLATIGFVYINSVIASRSVAFLLALDLASWSGLATGAGVLALLSYFLYIVNYPEGQSVSDAISQRGRNNKTL